MYVAHCCAKLNSLDFEENEAKSSVFAFNHHIETPGFVEPYLVESLIKS